jgi:hypothetical protein
MSDVKKTVETIRALPDELLKLHGRYIHVRDLKVLANLYELGEERTEAIKRLVDGIVKKKRLAAIRTIINTTHPYPMDVADDALK